MENKVSDYQKAKEICSNLQCGDVVTIEVDNIPTFRKYLPKLVGEKWIATRKLKGKEGFFEIARIR